jgi:hypothetical protein
MAKSRNPYHQDDGSRVVRPSVVVWLDILGFLEMARAAHRDGTENEFLARSYAGLERGRTQWLEQDESYSKDEYALKSFTDNIVIGWPISDDAETELGGAFRAVAGFQFEMINAGFFIRGAISVGDVYVDDIAVVGGGLIEAYEGESTLARDPRIVLTSSATKAVEQHLKYYGSRSGGGAHAPQNRDLLKDADGQLFINYLDDTVLYEYDDPQYEVLNRHKLRISEKLEEYKSRPAIWNKYAWVARYHNYFCDLHSSHFNETHKIDVGRFELSPSLIIDPRRKRSIPGMKRK